MEQNNSIMLVGEIIAKPEYSHETFKEKFYTVNIAVKRLSGDLDILEVMLSEKIVDIESLKIGDKYYIEGSIRSFNKYVENEERRRLVLNVFAKQITNKVEEYDEFLNNVELEGHICKKPIYRKTPFDREISDILLAVNRQYGKSDYLPCIAWGRNARQASNLEVGTKIKLTGRMQSREYIKKIEDKEEKKTAYEISMITLEII